jgi:hypothetical protein
LATDCNILPKYGNFQKIPWNLAILSLSHIGIFCHDQVATLCPKEKQMAILLSTFKVLTLYFFSDCNWRVIISSPIKDLIPPDKKIGLFLSFFLSFFLLEKGNALKALFPRIWKFQSPNMWPICMEKSEPFQAHQKFMFDVLFGFYFLWEAALSWRMYVTLCLEECMSCSNYL